MANSLMQKRKLFLDILKCILIVCVVVGHSGWEYARYIYWFHMPLFFSISGFLFQPHFEMSWQNWIRTRTKKYFVPYCLVLLFDTFFVSGLSKSSIFRAVYGGRVLSGVYWYITCLFFTEIIFRLLLQKISNKKRITIICLSLIVAALTESKILYSFIPDRLNWPIYFNMPLDVDVCLFVVPLFCLSYFNRQTILLFIENKNQMRILFIISCVIIAVLLGVDLFIKPLFSTDLKYVQYSLGSILSIIPFGIILLCISKLLERFKIIGRILGFIGRSSLWIMYFHLPFKTILNRTHIEINISFLILLSVLIPCVARYCIQVFRKHLK